MIELMEDGGWVMWALLALSVTALGAAVERTVVLWRARAGVEELVAGLKRTLLRNPSLGEARKLCRQGQGPVARVAAAGLARLNRPPRQLEATLERQAQSELRRLSRGLKVLATTAATAPLLGFLGTVTGMIASFKALVEYGMSNPTMVAQGIQEALTTTAAGLVVAVPAQLLYSFLSSRLDRITGDIEGVAHLLLEACGATGSRGIPD